MLYQVPLLNDMPKRQHLNLLLILRQELIDMLELLHHTTTGGSELFAEDDEDYGGLIVYATISGRRVEITVSLPRPAH